jgi:hypothetical protein
MRVKAHTGDNLDAIAGDKLDALLALGRHADDGDVFEGYVVLSGVVRSAVTSVGGVIAGERGVDLMEVVLVRRGCCEWDVVGRV